MLQRTRILYAYHAFPKPLKILTLTCLIPFQYDIMSLKKIYLILSTLVLVACSGTEQSNQSLENKFEQTGSIERLDPQMDQLIADSAVIEILASGFSWSEGPVWVPTLNSLLFSDIPKNTVYQWNETDSLSVYLRPSGYTGSDPGEEGWELGSNGLLINRENQLILCQHGDRRLVRMAGAMDDPKEVYEPIADQYEGKRFNSPNDVAMTSGGDFFFTDPPYGLQEDDTKELDFQGVYKVDTTGVVTLQVDSLTRPNGVALSPDEKTLYVAVSDPERAKYYAYDLDEDFNVVGGKVLLDVTSLITRGLPGLPDGLKVDNNGNLFATGPGGVLVISPEGKHLGTILTGQRTANCAFNEDKTILYMTAHMHLMRVKL